MEGQNDFDLFIPTPTERSRRCEVPETRQRRTKETHVFNQLKGHRDTKAELNRRSQVCEVLTGTGISRREKRSTAVAARPSRSVLRMSACRDWRFAHSQAPWKWSSIRVPLQDTDVLTEVAAPPSGERLGSFSAHPTRDLTGSDNLVIWN